jgi:hypothetical protein
MSAISCRNVIANTSAFYGVTVCNPVRSSQTFRRTLLPPFSVSKCKFSNHQDAGSTCRQVLCWLPASLTAGPLETSVDMYKTTPLHVRVALLQSLLWERQIQNIIIILIIIIIII